MNEINIYQEKIVLKTFDGEIIELDNATLEQVDAIMNSGNDRITLGSQKRRIRKSHIVDYGVREITDYIEFLVNKYAEPLKSQLITELANRKKESKKINERILLNIVEKLNKDLNIKNK